MQRHAFLILIAAMACTTGSAAQEPTVIVLTQTGCQFMEPENGVDLGYAPRNKEDCEEINERSSAERVASANVLTLKPGRYTFRVSNVDVPYELGFWLRAEGLLDRARLPSTSGGGLTAGSMRDYTIDLVPGDYVYSCPLNPTPNYRLVVQG